MGTDLPFEEPYTDQPRGTNTFRYALRGIDIVVVKSSDDH